MTEHTWTLLKRRLDRAGFERSFLEQAILPDWWGEECERDPDLLCEMDLRVARFLEVPIATVRNPQADLRPRIHPGAPLRRVRDLARERLAPAIHAALKIAEAVVRNLRNPALPVVELPEHPAVWREQLTNSGSIDLDSLLYDLWERRIPVIPAESLPAPSFQGLAGLVQGRPVIVLGHRHDDPGRVAFVVAHEAAHICAGDCRDDAPVVDEQDEIADSGEMERRADLFAIHALVGRPEVPRIDATGFRDLAKAAAELETTIGADPSVLIYSWARNSGDYSTAARAVAALYRATGARTTLKNHFRRETDLDSAPDSDRRLLGCVYGAFESE